VDCFPCIQLSSRIMLHEHPVTSSGLGKIGRFIRRYYAPFLLKPFVKGVVVVLFGGLFVASVISMQHIQLGLGEWLQQPVVCDSLLIVWVRSTSCFALGVISGRLL